MNIEKVNAEDILPCKIVKELSYEKSMLQFQGISVL